MMTLAILLAGVVILAVVVFGVIRVLDHRDEGTRRLRIKVTLVPPALDFEVERRSD
jgi:hypothetical protein